MRHLSIPAVLSLALLIGGCAESGVDAAQPTQPSRSSTAASSPSPTSEPAVKPAALVVRADLIEVLSADGAVIATASLLTDRESILGTLESALGAEPISTPVPAGEFEGQPGTEYRWQGLSLFITEVSYGPDDPGISLEILAPAVGDVSISTVEGLAVGSSAGALDPADLIWEKDGVLIFDVEPTTVSAPVDPEADGDADVESVWSVHAYSDGTTVTRMTLPQRDDGV